MSMILPAPTYYWRTRENTGTTTTSRFVANTITLANGATWGVGINGSAIELDGVNDNCTLATTITMGVGDSLSWWMNWDVIAKMSWGASTNANDYVWHELTNTLTVRATGTAVNFTIPVQIADTWYHFVLTRHSTDKADVYVNGVVSTTGSGTLGAVDMALNRFGSRGDGTFPFNGQGTEMAYWNGTVLTAAQAVRIYNNGAPSDLTKMGRSDPASITGLMDGRV